MEINENAGIEGQKRIVCDRMPVSSYIYYDLQYIKEEIIQRHVHKWRNKRLLTYM